MKSYESSSYNKEERSHYSSRKPEPKASVNQGHNVPPRPQSTQNPPDPQNPPTQERKSRFNWRHLLFIWLSLTILSNGINWLMNTDTSDVEEQPEETIDYPWTSDDEEESQDALDENIQENVDEYVDESELHAEAVKAAKQAGVSTEGTTEEILNRIIEKQLESIR